MFQPVRLLCCILLFITGSATAQSLLWEHSPASDNGLSYWQYMHSLNIASANWYSQCKDQNCSYWVAVGEQRYRVGKDSSLIAQSRYQQVTYALYRNGEQYYLADNHGQRVAVADAALANCVSFSDGVISLRGELICLSGRTLRVGNRSQTLPARPLYYRFATSYRGHWVLAMLDKDFNLHVIDASGQRQTRTGLQRHSDFDHILSVFPQTPGNTWVALYEYRNKRNKNLSLYHLQGDNARHYTVTNSIGDDTGVRPELYQAANNELHVSTRLRSSTKFYRLRPESLPAQQPEANPYQTPDLADLLIGAGVRATHWSVSQSVESPAGSDGSTDKLASVKYDMNESVLREYRLAGQLAGNQIALTWLTSEAEQGMNQLERSATRKLYGSIGFERFFHGPTRLQLEFASELAGGVATYRDNNGAEQVVAFENDYQRFALLVTSELGWLSGVSYSRNNMPMAVGFFESGLGDPDIYFDPDFELQKLTYVIGYDTAQYTSRYLFNSRGFYLDGRVGIGLYRYDIGADILRQAEAVSGKEHNDDIGLALDGFVEAGYFWQARSVRWGGLGAALQAGVSADVETYYNGISEDSEIEADEIRAAFERTDVRWGPFVRLNLMF
ncbi:hypothetical protein GJQ54_00135 [Oceanospirillaceae bacterium ASx5O]|nr:hypothetical protein GJQ54_00135 [Oceanospirillaceae bacterium ASx5O]